MSAIEESPAAEGPVEVIQVLFALIPEFGAQELCGPLEVLANAYHRIHDPGSTLSLLDYQTPRHHVSNNGLSTVK